MLCSLKEIDRYSVGATDGEIGKIKDFYFDDSAWVIRYFSVDSSASLSRRQVLISPISIDRSNSKNKPFFVSLTRDQVEKSPEIDLQGPISRQHEKNYLGYYGYAHYWGGAGVWGQGAYPGIMMPGAGYDSPVSDIPPAQTIAPLEAREQDSDSERGARTQLRSCAVVAGYHIDATDGALGDVTDFIIDEESWVIRHLAVTTGDWWPGHQLLIAPEWIKDVNCAAATLLTDHSRAQVRTAPTWKFSVN